MGEAGVTLFGPSYNRSVSVVASPTTLTGDTGALLLREASRLLGLDALLSALPDGRDGKHVTYSLAEVVRTRVLLLAQGWGDQGDADTLRHDPALRLAASDRAGERPLGNAWHLPSQPTLSRMQHALSGEAGTAALDRALCTTALRRIRAAEPARRRLALDIDTLPLEVHGHQDGASYNAHYGITCFQPLVVLADTGDILAVRLRGGASPSAEESFEVLERVIDAAREAGFTVSVRMDCGFASAHIMRELDRRRVRFVTRLRTTQALQKGTAAWLGRTLAEWRASPDPRCQPRTATLEVWEKAQKGERVRRIVAVAVEPGAGELLPRRFFLCTSLARPEGGSRAILAHYRQRGTAEGHIGELVRCAVPSLRAVARGGDPSRVGIRDNNVALLLAALAYELLHHLRRGIERKTGQGWSLARLRERVLRVATSVIRHARRTVFRVCPTGARLWQLLGNAVCPAAQLALEAAR